MFGRGRGPSNTADWEGGVPLQSAGVVISSVGRFTIRSTFCEVAASQSCLAGLIKCGGVAIHPLSGELNLQSAEHFGRLKVAVKRGEVAHRSRGPREVTQLYCHQVCEIVPSRHEAPYLVESGLNQIVGLRARQDTVRSRRRSLHPCKGIHSLDQCARVEVRGRF